MALKRFVLTVIFAVLLLPALASAGEHQRDSWYIGFGLGMGLGASYEADGEEITFEDWLSPLDTGPEVAINFKVGKTLNENHLLGFDITAVGQSGTGYGIDAQIQITDYFIMWTYFPQEEGFFTRLGGGASVLSVEITSYSDSYSDSVNGYGLLGGVGYAFWLGEGFNLTVNLDHSRQFYSGSNNDPDGSQFTALYLGFDWY